jgi:DNA-binding CsgD family transcriptional regulator
VGLTKADRFINLRRFVIERSGETAWGEILAALPDADATAARAVAPSGWYDSALHGRLVRALCAHAGDVKLARELGRFEAEHDLTTVHRWFVRVIPPAFAIRNMDLFWRRYHDTGSWTSEIRGRKIVARLRDWEVEPALCRFLQGYLGRMLEFFGNEEAVVIHPLCRADGEALCEFRSAHFDAGSVVRSTSSVIRSGDLPNVVYELSHLTDLEALADAILKILQGRFSFSYVALWMKAEPASDYRLLRSSGAKGEAAPRCFLLQTGGRTVGRLDVESPPGQEDAAVLERLLACFAVALGGALANPTSSRPGGAPSSPDEVARRIAAATRRWELTARESEVLMLLLRGLTNKEIAAELGCQEGTVEVHVSKILKKSSAGNRAGVVSKVWSEG